MNKRRPKKVLVIGMIDSVHLAKWLGQFRGEDIEFLILPSGPNRKVHPLLKYFVNSGVLSIKILLRNGKFSLPIWGLDIFLFQNRLRSTILKREIKDFRPDYVHLLEFQHAGYIAANLHKHQFFSAKVIATNYGSDIYWFARFPKHKKKIQKILRLADFYSAECNRDLGLAAELGFKGVFLPVIPNAGGIKPIDQKSVSESWGLRNIILIKGYEGWAGRAKLILEALQLAQSQIAKFEIVCYSANFKTILKIWYLRVIKSMRITYYKKGALSQKQLFELMDRSLIHIAASKTDGISTATLEAVSRGVFPMQTSSSCIGEWLHGADNSSLFDVRISAEELSKLITVKLRAAHKLMQFSLENINDIANRTDPEQVASKARTFYTV